MVALRRHPRTKCRTRKICRSTRAILIAGSDRILRFGKKQLNVTRLAHEGVDTTVRTERPTAPAHRLVHLHVIYDQRLRVDAAQLGVALSVLQQPEQEHARLFRPPPHRYLPVVALWLALHPDLEAPEGYNLLLFYDRRQVLLRPLERHALDGRSCLMCVLEMNTQVASTSLDSYSIAKSHRNRGKRVVLLVSRMSTVNTVPKSPQYASTSPLAQTRHPRLPFAI